jgi:PAS domain-containing protein
MAGKNWQGGGKASIPARAAAVLIASIVPLGVAWAVSEDMAPASYISSAEPDMAWEVLIGGIVVCSFLASIALWIFSALRKVKRSHLRRNAFISSALNNLNQGVVISDPKKRIVFCNNRYLEIYGLQRSDISDSMTGPDLAELWRRRGILDVSAEDFYDQAGMRKIHSGQIFSVAERRFGGNA